MNNEEIDTITDLLFENGYDVLKTINDLSNKLKEKDKEIKRLNNLINKTISYYYKTLSEYNKPNKKMPDEAVMMFNLLEGNNER